MKEEKCYYIPAGRTKIYVEKEVFDEFNRLRSRQAYSNNKFREHTCELNEETDSLPVLGVEDEVMRRALLEELAQAVKALDDAERKVIKLIYFEELTERMAARRIGIERYQVNRIKLRALAKLKNKISL